LQKLRSIAFTAHQLKPSILFVAEQEEKIKLGAK